MTCFLTYDSLTLLCINSSSPFCKSSQVMIIATTQNPIQRFINPCSHLTQARLLPLPFWNQIRTVLDRIYKFMETHASHDGKGHANNEYLRTIIMHAWWQVNHSRSDLHTTRPSLLVSLWSCITYPCIEIPPYNHSGPGLIMAFWYFGASTVICPWIPWILTQTCVGHVNNKGPATHALSLFL